MTGNRNGMGGIHVLNASGNDCTPAELRDLRLMALGHARDAEEGRKFLMILGFLPDPESRPVHSTVGKKSRKPGRAA